VAATTLLQQACAGDPKAPAPPPRNGDPQSEQAPPQDTPVHKAPPPEYGDRVVQEPAPETTPQAPAGPAPVAPPTEATPAGEVDQKRAQQIARQEGAKAGYDLNDYALQSTQLEGDDFWVRFELHGRGRPGGHFSVQVNKRTGGARVIRGK
ncbi:MAG TPA: hypothetical protein PKA88_30015, partial [Polyangiaceae bacterium]|nr:hypothetical protein [Polyangiaceae bacterium]